MQAVKAALLLLVLSLVSAVRLPAVQAVRPRLRRRRAAARMRAV